MKPIASARGILGASVALGMVLLATRGVAAFKEVVVSRSFGTAGGLDAFLVAFGIVNYIASAVSNAGMSSLVPALSRARADSNPSAEARLIATAFLAAFGLSTLAVGLVLLFNSKLQLLTAPGFDGQQTLLMEGLMLVLAPVPFLALAQAIVSGTLNSRYGFRSAAALTAITPLSLVVLLLIVRRPLPWHLGLGTVLGMSLELLALLALAQSRRVQLFARVSLAEAWHMTRALGRDFVPLFAGTALASLSPLVDQAFASAAGPGGVSTLNYASRIPALGMGIGISSIGLIVLPHFSDLAARDAWSELGALLRKLSVWTFGLALPVVAALCLASEPLVRAVFERGQFTVSDTLAVAPIQSLYALQIPFHLVGIVGVRALNAMRQNRLVMLVVVWNVACNVVGDYLLMGWLGLRGIALATSCMYATSCVLILVFAELEVRRRTQVTPERFV